MNFYSIMTPALTDSFTKASRALRAAGEAGDDFGCTSPEGRALLQAAEIAVTKIGTIPYLPKNPEHAVNELKTALMELTGAIATIDGLLSERPVLKDTDNQEAIVERLAAFAEE